MVHCVHRATIDVNLRHAETDYVDERSKLKRDLGSKDAELRKLKKANLQLKRAQDSLTQVKLMHDKKKTEVKEVVELNVYE